MSRFPASGAAVGFSRNLTVGLSVLFAISTVSAQGSGSQESGSQGSIPKGWLKVTKPAEPAPRATTAPAKAESNTAKLETLLTDPGVVLVRASAVFDPGGASGKPEIVAPGNRYAAFKDGNLVGVFDDPTAAQTKLGDKAKAKVINLDKRASSSFVMPGIVDADSRWFKSTADLSDSSATMATKAGEALDTWQSGWRRLVEQGGVTRVYVPSSTTAQAAGPGAIVDLDLEAGPAAAKQPGAMRFLVTSTGTKGTTLSRDSVVRSLRGALDAAKKYGETKEKWDKDLAEYKKKRKEYLAYYKKNPMKAAAKPEPAESDAGENAAGRRGSGRRGSGRRGGMPRIPREVLREIQEKIKDLPPEQRRAEFQRLINEWLQKNRPQQGQPEQKPEEKKPEAKAPTESKPDEKKAPPRPKYPNEPKPNPTSEALLDVLANKTTLRLEVHRAAEIEALLEIVDEYDLKHVVLTGATEAWKAAKALRSAGVTVLLSPGRVGSTGFDTLPLHVASSAAKLSEAGVPVAFGSSGRGAASYLTLIAAEAVAAGMAPEQALKALTTNAAIASGTKAGHGLVVFTKSPFESDARVLCIIDGSQVRYIDE